MASEIPDHHGLHTIWRHAELRKAGNCPMCEVFSLRTKLKLALLENDKLKGQVAELDRYTQDHQKIRKIILGDQA